MSINNLSSYQKNLAKEQNKPKSNRRKEIIKMRVESVKLKINEQKIVQKINETKNWLTNIIYKID